MNGKKLTLLVILLLILDQALKIWVKTHMTLGEAIILIPDWFQLYFIENKGAAFGMHIATPGTMDWGKLLLGLFRIGMVVALIWLIRHFMRKKAPQRSVDRIRADSGRSDRQHHRQRLLRADLLGLHTRHGRPFRRPLRRIHDGQSRGYVLLSALSVEQRSRIPRFPGR